jgi:tetraacyldisaccharide 4'-kinase
VDIVLVSSADLGDWLLPAGNRREPLSALRRATVFAVSEGDGAPIERLAQLGWKQPVWRYRREMIVPEVAGPVAAFCGIARPEQFFLGLERAGMQVAARRAFPDHHRFTEPDLVGLRQLGASSSTTGFVTTAKDAVRLGDRAAKLDLPLAVADLRVSFVDEDMVVAGLQTYRGILNTMADRAGFHPLGSLWRHIPGLCALGWGWADFFEVAL